MDKVSFIVSSRGRPLELRSCLASLALQDPPFEVFVAATSENPHTIENVRKVCDFMGMTLIETGEDNIFKATASVIPKTTGEWLVFPNDDCYLVPAFNRYMLTAACANDWDLVYCDCLYDPRMFGHYDVFEVKPKACRIDKVCIMLRKAKFEAFPWLNHPTLWVMSDSLLAQSLVKNGIAHGKAPGVMAVHN